MSTLTVLKFPTAGGAQQMEITLLDMQKQQLIAVQDAAIVIWPQGARRPKAEQVRAVAGQGKLTGPFWGMLFGLIFFVPYFGPDLDTAIGALSNKFGDYGIDANFIKQTRAKVTEGTSALFLLTNATVEGKVVAAMKGQSCEIIAMNLPRAKEDKLRAVFGAK